MARLLVDTDVFIDHIRGGRPVRSRGHRIFYSVITRTELFVGGNERAVNDVLDPHSELPVDRQIAERAARIARAIPIDLADALISATALEHDLTVITRNIRDFRDVPKLKVRAEVP